jgi:hypothetical protein
MNVMTSVRAAALVLAVSLVGVSCGHRKWPGDQGVHDRLREQLTSGRRFIEMADVAPFRWSRLEVFGPYTPQEHAEHRLGFKWPYQWSAVHSLDDRNFLVFVDSNRVVSAFELSRVTADITPGTVYRNSSRLLVESTGTSKRLRPAEPDFESDLWPEEGIPVIEAAEDRLALYESPREGLEPISQRTMKPGSRIRFDSTRYQTIAPVTFQIRASDTIRATLYGKTRRVERDVYYGGGRDTVLMPLASAWGEVLQYRAEGECFIRIEELVFTARCPAAAAYIGARIPRTLWWAWTPGPGGAGWFVVSDSTAKVVDRRF